MNIFIKTAWANANSNSQSNPYSLAIMVAIFAGIFYFMIFRPQQKRNKIHKELLSSISKGDEILTNGGLIGRVVRTTETGYIFIILNEKNDTSGNEILIKRDCVTAILPKGTMKAL
ncbi:preprotein translocase subunit YajC [Candidatus Blochmannia vicinus]|uniref:Sec translocon accessory complex subunit YajC n=1 Tax=Candidatus Blochmannia vicinus (nom. nud.) TaxID=251540 RepID=A0A9Q8TVF2_9ENTR|nr:preprotein translocase subunit YajC [Candidatus Blochmannia vicinus]URJ27963.1 preprotein translocase subunit YajC [Candidatus Blochmannia vicinus]URJ30765.1 preprotein translocase subunit YajC [Candidatus Blochmannia vicinus]URJ32908.1 preprotein translocase subunit YajC [Candidatus Blochmannia vicinus]